MFRCLSALLVSLLCASHALAQPVARTHEITIDDYPSIAAIAECAASPDGKLVAYVDSRWNPDTDRRNRDLWVVPADGSAAPQRLTFDLAADHSPRWSADSKHIFFLSARGGAEQPPNNGKTQVWRIPATGGAPQPVTTLADSIAHYELADADTYIYYTLTTTQDDAPWKGLRAKHSEIINPSLGARTVSQLWRLDLNTWRSEKLLDNGRYIANFAVSANGQWVAMHTCPDDTLITNEGQSRLDIYDTANERVIEVSDKLFRTNVPSPYGWLTDLAFSPDSRAVAFSVSWDGYPTRIYLAEQGRATWRVHELKRPDDGATLTGTLDWRPDSRDLHLIAERRARQHVYAIADVHSDEQGATTVRTPGDFVVWGFSFPADGSPPAYIISGKTHARDIFRSPRPGAYDRLTDNNPQMRTWNLPQIREFEWTGANDTPCHGILELPYGYNPETDGPLPTIVEIHGGPTAASRIAFRFWCYGRTNMPSRGYALFSPNYRGSTGYGDMFMTDLVGAENDIEVRDIITGIEALEKAGIADMDKLGVMGWSNGGYLTNCLIAAYPKFKAASSGAGVMDMYLQWAVEDTPGHVINFMRGLPWQQPEHYIKASPGYNMADVRTPTLIHCGANDPRVPVYHSRSLFRALHHYLHVPAMLLEYPEQGHGLGRMSMRMAKMEWDEAWFDKYILGRETHDQPHRQDHPHDHSHDDHDHDHD